MESDQPLKPALENFFDTEAVNRAMALAARDARLRHKLMGVPLVSWENGQVVEIPPEQIVVDP